MTAPFSASPKTVSISVSNAFQRVLVTNARGVQQVRMHNDGSATVWIAWGDATVVATTASGMSLPSGAIEVQTFNAPFSGDLYFAVIAVGSTGSVYFTPGAGI